MTKPTMPFPLPVKLPGDLARVRDYWRDLRRRESSMPFWDDVKLSSLGGVADHLMLIDVFDKPRRFRFNSAGKLLSSRYGSDLLHKFSDGMEVKSPFEYFESQSSATVESAAPTFYRNAGRRAAYSRLLLPMWGNGRIEMMLGAVAFPRNA